MVCYISTRAFFSGKLGRGPGLWNWENLTRFEGKLGTFIVILNSVPRKLSRAALDFKFAEKVYNNLFCQSEEGNMEI